MSFKHCLPLAALFTTLLLGAGATLQAQDLAVGGYLQGSIVQLKIPDSAATGTKDQHEYRLHQRFNLRWTLTPELSTQIGVRTRLFSGDQIQPSSDYVNDLRHDPGPVDLSATLINRDRLLLHAMVDRLYIEWDQGDWLIRTGRQRINWGVNLITNPNDIFNIYTIYDVDYPERPGSDALRVQRFTGPGSRIEFAVSPGKSRDQSVAAVLYAFAPAGFDLQVLGGYYHDKLAIGGGWAGDLQGAGFKGEVMIFHDLKKNSDNPSDTNLIVAGSIDYMFENGLFLITELLYNKNGGRHDYRLFGAGLTADNPSFCRYQTVIQISYMIHPLLNGTLTGIYYLQEKALYLSPTLTLSVSHNLDLTLLGQLLAGGHNTLFEGAADLYMVSLKYNF